MDDIIVEIGELATRTELQEEKILVTVKTAG